jgi:hypothetical protein
MPALKRHSKGAWEALLLLGENDLHRKIASIVTRSSQRNIWG